MYPNKSTRKITRREFLRVSGVMLTGVVVVGQVKPATASGSTIDPLMSMPQPVEPAIVAATYHEAPMLAELVQRGVIPPVDQRLPTTPCVLPALEGVHNFDGLIARAYTGQSDRAGLLKMKDHAFVWFDQNLNLVPRLCLSWEANPTATEWTLHLRPGTRWSDGVEFTTDEIVWWYQHVLIDPRLYAEADNWKAGGVLMTVAAADKYTIKFTFVQPKTLFIYQLARDGNSDNAGTSFLFPSHYMQRYHNDFAPDPVALEAEAIAAGFSDWTGYFNYNRNVWSINPARPGLGPWIPKNAMGQSLFVMERNPFNYCVDSDQNQLPYNDLVTHRYYDSASIGTFTSWILQGAIDFQARGVDYGKYSIYKAGELAGRYQVIPGVSGGHLAIALNHTTKTPRLRVFFQNRKVRLALSLAVDRAAMNTALYAGVATPRQYSPLSISPQYYPALSNAHIAYDAAQANILLDEAGYSTKDAQGFRLWNDSSGERISFIIQGPYASGSTDEAGAQRVVQYFAAVGIQATYQFVERDTYNQHCTSNEIEAGWFGADRSILPLVTEAPIFRGTIADRPWAAAWSLWYNNPSDPNAEEPPVSHWIRDIWSKWDQISQESGETQRNLLFNQILAIWATELPMIGYLGELPSIAIVKNNMHNFLAGFPDDDTTSGESIYNPETLSWESSLTPSLSINYPDGKPGSFFSVVGTGFPAYSTALVSVNEHAIDTLFTDGAGRVEFVLDTAQAGTGFYEVTVRVNPMARTTFKLANGSTLRLKEGSAAQLTVPSGIGSNYVYLPSIRR